MFCLRSWIPILFFLTNASPIYLILFISAAYILNRPCVYCSLLLAILVLALFDFSGATTGGWFEPRYETQTSAGGYGAANDTTTAIHSVALGAVDGAISAAAGAVNVTASAAVDALLALGKRGLEEGGSSWMGWTRRLWRSGLKIDCLGVTVRL